MEQQAMNFEGKSDETIAKTKDMVLSIWEEHVKRDGVNDFLLWLEKSDFFTAPCSTKFHLATKGGLAKHSLNVYLLLSEKMEKYRQFADPENKVTEESLVICGLGHDLCKVGVYVEGGTPCSDSQFSYLSSLLIKYNCHRRSDLRSLYEEGPAITVKRNIPSQYASAMINWLKGGLKGEVPQAPTEFAFDDGFPMGHGEKSVSVLQDFMKLTDEEKLAIRWHMLAFDAGIHFNYPSGFAFRKASEIPLVTLLFTSDYEASQIVERGL